MFSIYLKLIWEMDIFRPLHLVPSHTKVKNSLNILEIDFWNLVHNTNLLHHTKRPRFQPLFGKTTLWTTKSHGSDYREWRE